MTDRLNRARALAENGDVDESWKLVEQELIENPDNVLALLLGSFIMEKAKRLPVAYMMAKRVTELSPEKSAGWLNLGRTADDMWLLEQSESAHKEAIKRAETNQLKASSMVNLAALYINTGRFTEAEHLCVEAIELDPASWKAKANYGFCLLARKEWGEGWKYYEYSLGSDSRKKNQYNDESQWDGTPGKTVVVYGEQGLGDEICFASMLPDALAISGKVILECDKRLVGLFKRSFPSARVYGTRNKEKLNWDESDRDIGASIPSGGLGALFRNETSQFPGKPYLKADPDRVMMWKGLWSSKDKPVIGVSWSGGLRHTAAKYRKIELEQLLPLFNAIDAHWVVLEYKDKQEEVGTFAKQYGVDIRVYPWATLTNDYDDTAGLVASLDAVVSMQQSVIHLAGGLGVPTWVFLPKTTQWRYGEDGNSMPWYQSVKLIRQKVLGEWSGPVNKAIKELHAYLRGIQRTAKKAA